MKSLKVFFVLLCNGRLRDKFLYLFRQFEDSSNSVSKKALLSMLKTVAHFAEFFGKITFISDDMCVCCLFLKA